MTPWSSHRLRSHHVIELLVLLVFVLLACACRTPVPPYDAMTMIDATNDHEASRDVVMRSDTFRVDARPGVSDAGYPTFEFVGEDRILLHPVQLQNHRGTQCLGRQGSGVDMYTNYAGNSCRSGEWYYTQNGGEVERTSLRRGVTELIVAAPDSSVERGMAAFVACQGDRIVMKLSTYRDQVPPQFPGATETDRVMVAIFESDLSLPGRIIWSERANVDLPGHEIAASDRLIAWDNQRYGGPPNLIVAGPNGENQTMIPIAPGGIEFWQLMADGPNLIWNVEGSDIFRWNADTRVHENLTNDLANQWSAFISGERIVWVDQRDTPTGTERAPNNPEIYLYDLRTRERRRLTNDPPERPVGQAYPSIVGDWVLWSDFRNSRNPNPGAWFTERMELYGYHIPSGTTQPLLEGNIQVEKTRSFDDGMISAICVDVGGRQPSRAISLPIPTLIVRDQ